MISHHCKICFVLFLLIFSMHPATTLAEDSKGSLSISLENDLFGAGTDEHYTHGTEISYVSDTYMPRWFRKTASFFPFGELNDDTRFSWALGQKIYTPQNIEETALILDDRPYAGWLYLSLGLVTEDVQEKYRHVDSLELIFGVIGEDSGAENVQTTVHEWIGATIPQGWDNQLHDEYTVDLRYGRTWLFPLIGDYVDILPSTGFTFGTSQRMVNGGLTFRIGSGLNADYGPPLIRPSLSGANYFKPDQPWYWYFFVGAYGRYVGYNVFLDGNRDGESHSVEKNDWVGDAQVGLVVGAGNWRFSLTNVYRTEEFETQAEPDEFGSISVSYRF